ncbi:MAG: hypothetical protein F6K47_07490, partial [Symploca sp. SIO2E6]|nr:hypothetical protein [Symploca sp. SIO2E6]
MIEDILAIVHIFSCRLYGLRKYKKQMSSDVELQCRMLQVERHIIDRQHNFFKTLDDLAFKSKNLYNKANYYMRQNFFEKGGKLNDRLNIKELYALTKPTESYAALPQKVSAGVIKQVIHDWKAWFQAMKQWFVVPEEFEKKPQIPRYKHKELGRNLLIYDNQSIGQKGKKKGNGIIKLACSTVKLFTDIKEVKEVRVVPATASYVIEVVYEKEIVPARLNPLLIAGID